MDILYRKRKNHNRLWLGFWWCNSIKEKRCLFLYIFEFLFYRLRKLGYTIIMMWKGGVHYVIITRTGCSDDT